MNRSRTLAITSAALGPLVAAGTFAAVRAADDGSTVAASSQTQQQDPWSRYGGGQWGGYGGAYAPQGLGDSGTRSTTSQPTAATSSQSTGVVLINTTIGYGQAQAAGTGLVLGSNGIIVTNHHVVAGATGVTVTDPSTGSTYPATVLGYDATTDVAVLQLQGASGLKTVTTDPTSSVGEAVTAIGNAAGQSQLVAAAGSILATGVGIDVTEDDGSTAHLTGLIENSSDVVQGDSGGALLDGDGEVVGMNVAASSGSAQVTGYAIPISAVTTIANQILAGQASSTVTIGTPAGLGVEVSTQDGAYVQGVVRTGAAAAAGVEPGDTITSLASGRITSAEGLTAELKTLKPGQSTTIEWTDPSGATHRASVTLAQGPVG